MRRKAFEYDPGNRPRKGRGVVPLPPRPLPTLHPEMRGCTACSLHAQCKSPGIGWRWHPHSLPWTEEGTTIALVARNPGFNEDVEGHPLIGRSGNILLGVREGDVIYGRSGKVRAPRSLASPYIAGLEDITSIWYGNAIRCHTIGDASPPLEAYKACVRYTVEDLEALTSRRLIVLALGAEAVRALYHYGWALGGVPKLGDAIQQWRPLEVAPRTYAWATYHPAYLARNPNAIINVRDHMGLIRRWLDGTAPKRIPLNLTPAKEPPDAINP